MNRLVLPGLYDLYDLYDLFGPNLYDFYDLSGPDLYDLYDLSRPDLSEPGMSGPNRASLVHWHHNLRMEPCNSHCSIPTDW